MLVAPSSSWCGMPRCAARSLCRMRGNPPRSRHFGSSVNLDCEPFCSPATTAALHSLSLHRWAYRPTRSWPRCSPPTKLRLWDNCSLRDGVNDAAALAQSDLGLAMSTGSDATIEASDLTIVGGDLRLAVDAIRLSRRTLATMRGNLFWACAYNVAAIPLAAFGLLSPLLAGAAMAFSSVF